MRDLRRTRRLVALRRRLEDQRRGALLRAEARVRAADDEVRAAIDVREAFARSLVRPGTEDARALVHASGDHDAARAEEARLKAAAETRREEAAGAQAALAEARRATKAIERAFGRLDQARKEAAARREQQLLDELAARAVFLRGGKR